MFLIILKKPLGDLLQNNCSKSLLNELKYVYENILLLLKFHVQKQPITIAHYLIKKLFLRCIFNLVQLIRYFYFTVKYKPL